MREMAQGARRPGANIAAGNIADPEVGEGPVGLTEPWTIVIKEREDALAFFDVWNDYRRRIYEGPDAEDPDEAAADWMTPLTRVWNGEYAGFGGEPDSVQITIQSGGNGATYYPNLRCGTTLQLTSTSGAFGRVTQYRERPRSGRGCGGGGTVTLERTGENRMRFNLSRGFAGNLTRE